MRLTFEDGRGGGSAEELSVGVCVSGGGAGLDGQLTLEELVVGLAGQKTGLAILT